MSSFFFYAHFFRDKVLTTSRGGVGVRVFIIVVGVRVFWALKKKNSAQ